MIRLSQDKLRRLAAELRADAEVAADILSSADWLAIAADKLERDREQLRHDKAAQIALLRAVK